MQDINCSIEPVQQLPAADPKMPWARPSVNDLPVAIGTQSIGLGNNDGSASHT